MFRRICILAPLTLSGVACNDNQAEFASLRSQTQLAQQQNADVIHQMKEFEQRITRLEEQQGAMAAASNQSPPKPQPSLPDTATVINRAIAECVKKVRSLEKNDSINARPYGDFDAYYNAGNGRVEDNNHWADRGPNYAFNKCMAAKGVPLT